VPSPSLLRQALWSPAVQVYLYVIPVVIPQSIQPVRLQSITQCSRANLVIVGSTGPNKVLGYRI
jgi:hypothetical protein